MKNNSRKIMQVKVRAGTGREHFVNYQERQTKEVPKGRKEKDRWSTGIRGLVYIMFLFRDGCIKELTGYSPACLDWFTSRVVRSGLFAVKVQAELQGCILASPSLEHLRGTWCYVGLSGKRIRSYKRPERSQSKLKQTCLL